MHSMPSCLPRRGLREVTTRWRPVFPARSNTGDPFGLRGLSANEIERALISMVARSNEPLQSEAGYIDARPQTRSTKLLATHGRTIHRVKIHRQSVASSTVGLHPKTVSRGTEVERVCSPPDRARSLLRTRPVARCQELTDAPQQEQRKLRRGACTAASIERRPCCIMGQVDG